MKLSQENLNKFTDVAVPEYDRSKLSAGIIHVGLGNFHRAHQAWYLDRLFAKGKSHDWAIIGAGVRAGDSVQRDRLKGQDCLTTIIELDPGNNHGRVIGSMIDFLPVEEGNGALIAAMSKPEIRIVSLTVTEGGYYINSAIGAFDPKHSDMIHDAANPSSPRSVFGAIIAALRARKDVGLEPFTVMSCDNLPENGHVARDAVLGLAKIQDTDLATWIEANVAFPNSMVDCITPATGPREIALAKSFGVDDASPVVCEPFRQWVIEDNFPQGRPAFEELSDIGITFSKDVAKFELMKLRILNGGHATIAYPAGLLEIPYAHEAMEHKLINGFLAKLESDEIIPTIPPVPNTNLQDYYRLIDSRFSNPDIGDTIPRLALDGSNRQPKFILPVTRDRLKAGQTVRGLALVSALWCKYCAGVSDKGNPIEIVDEAAETLTALALRTKTEPLAFLELTETFGDVGESEEFRTQFGHWISALWTKGTEATLEEYIG